MCIRRGAVEDHCLTANGVENQRELSNYYEMCSNAPTPLLLVMGAVFKLKIVIIRVTITP